MQNDKEPKYETRGEYATAAGSSSKQVIEMVS